MTGYRGILRIAGSPAGRVSRTFLVSGGASGLLPEYLNFYLWQNGL
jgi:hypothetical protein